MSKTIDVGTPIFGALNEEFELPEITVHDFDVHAFDFLRAEDDSGAEPATGAEAPKAIEGAKAVEGGRRRKED